MPESPDRTDVNLVVNLTGLIKIFGDSLYEGFGAVVRELVQNSHDTITECVATGCSAGARLEDYWIDVVYDEAHQVLAVADNGIGMNADELASNLNNFASSKKKDIQEFIGESRQSKKEVGTFLQIGEYGVGFLSAMAVSERVDVWSRKEGQNPRKWSYVSGDKSARVADLADADWTAVINELGIKHRGHGTIVKCKLDRSVCERYYVDSMTVKESLREYASILPVRIFFNFNEQVSCRFRAWDSPATATQEAWEELIRGLTADEPVWTIPVYSPPDEHDLQGILWIPRRTKLYNNPRLKVYVKRMFVMNDTDCLLPSWARFISGIINSNKIDRIVSGNTIKRDIQTERAKDYIKSRIIESLRKLRDLPAERYREIAAPYDDTIKEAAFENQEFMECVWDKVRVYSSTRDEMTIPQYLDQVRGRMAKPAREVLYFYDSAAQENAATLVSSSTGVPVLCLVNGPDKLFMRKACEYRGITLLPFRELAHDLFRVDESQRGLQVLVDACEDIRIVAEIREFEPANIPAVLIQDKTMQELRTELLEGLKTLGREEMTRNIERIFKREDSYNRDVAFYLNSRNNLIRTLAAADAEIQKAVCKALYNISYMSAIPNLTREETETINSSITDVLLKLLKQEGVPIIDAEPGQKAAAEDTPIKVFMATPYREEETGRVEAAVRAVFEGAPYYFEVVLARDYILQGRLIENLRAHIESADAFIADISRLNPNVLLELGAVLLKHDGRPVLALRAGDGDAAAANMPADIADLLAIPYPSRKSSESDIAAAIRDTIEDKGKPTLKDLTDLLRRRTCRAMTKTLLSDLKRFRIDENERDMLLRAYPTVERFLAASNEQAEAATGIPAGIVSLIQTALKAATEGK